MSLVKLVFFCFGINYPLVEMFIVWNDECAGWDLQSRPPRALGF